MNCPSKGRCIVEVWWGDAKRSIKEKILTCCGFYLRKLNKLHLKRAVHFSQFVRYKLYSKTDVFRTRRTVTAFDGLVLKNKLLHQRVWVGHFELTCELACATDGTKLLAKSVSSTVPKKYLFWAHICVPGFQYSMIGLFKMPLSICQSGWRETRNAIPVIWWVPWGTQNKDIWALLCRRY